MRKLYLGFCLILLMIPLTTVLASANYNIEPGSKDSNGVWADNITFDKNLEFSHNIGLPGQSLYVFRINLQTESTVKIFVSGDHLRASIQVSKNGSYPTTLYRSEPDKNGTRVLSQVLYSGMYYIVFGNGGPEGSYSSGKFRIVINPV